MGATVDLKIAICIPDTALRKRFLKLLKDLHHAIQSADGRRKYPFTFECCENSRQTIDCIGHHLAAGEKRAAVLLFEVVDERSLSNNADDSAQIRHWVDEVRNEIRANCAAIAIMASPRRVPDIDRVVHRSADSGQLLLALGMIADRLTYTSIPEKCTLAVCPTVRLILKQHELMEYFKLRHRIYKIMGYLEEEIENTVSQMEINWCDRIALHIGAYQSKGGREQLVGTARVVIVASPDPQRRPGILGTYDRLVTALARQDPALQHALDRVLPLQLPIFHSQRLTGNLCEALRSENVCGELSRVIVDEEHRGAGLSGRLVEFALDEAFRVGVNRVFLECLDIHELLYQRHGFRRIDTLQRPVIGINQTMIGMELTHRPSTQLSGKVASAALALRVL